MTPEDRARMERLEKELDAYKKANVHLGKMILTWKEFGEIVSERDAARAEVELLRRRLMCGCGRAALHVVGWCAVDCSHEAGHVERLETALRERDEARAEVERLRKLRWPNG